MARNIAKPKLAEAGPGAGKTHTMVDEVVAAIQVLPPHRFLAAITYTNAAANTIRERLCRRVQLWHNVFVGTTHSFVNRFILAPFAELVSLLPEDRVYAPVDVYAKGRGAGIYTKNLIRKGVIPYDAMVPKARDILKMPSMRDRICERLAYIFVDEFQDADIGMFEVFEHFRKAGKTTLYFVGDPEQYVMSFAHRGHKPPAYDNIPYFRLKKKAELATINENHRSNAEIVTFANQFRADLKQQAVKPHRKEPRVLFIPSTSLKEIVRCYQALSANVETQEAQRTRLYLSEENATFDPIRGCFQLTQISNVARKTRTLLGDTLELLSLALDRSQRRACNDFDLGRLQWRAVGIRLLNELIAGEYGIEELKLFVSNTFDHSISKSRIPPLEDSLRLLNAELFKGGAAQRTELCASIRKAKGLQADAALVVAKSVVELKKWLQTDRSARVADKQDKCRLGYVAFTRPREMLCIACLEQVDEDVIQVLQDRGIVTVAHDAE
ncbi:MAG: UvrD-helicase domain-containing protein [Phycisphaerales bacterium]|nr:MAG: UvrD-helicase domain-containing protein [Phycisphaerales bacterium]